MSEGVTGSLHSNVLVHLFEQTVEMVSVQVLLFPAVIPLYESEKYFNKLIMLLTLSKPLPFTRNLIISVRFF